MCMFSASTGHLTDFHLVHLGAFAYRGASLAILEATAVLPAGRISPEDCGLWTDSQIAPIRRIADFIHSQNQKLGIQLAHAGRKASTCAPWLTERGQASIIFARKAGFLPLLPRPNAHLPIDQQTRVSHSDNIVAMNSTAASTVVDCIRHIYSAKGDVNGRNRTGGDRIVYESSGEVR